MKNVKLTLVQENANLEFAKAIDSDKISEISGTLCHKVLKVQELREKFKIDLGGFSFHRRFKLRIEIDGQKLDESICYVKNQLEMSITLKDTNKQNFVLFLHELVKMMMTEDANLIFDIEEIADQCNFKLN